MTKSRKFNKLYAFELIRIAEQDLETAKVLIHADLKRKENILFHIEQCIEKCLKAMLCKHELSVPLVHELSILIDKLPKDILPPNAEELTDLTQFATIRRYEEGKAEFTKEEIESAYRLAEQVLSWAKKT